MKLFEELRLGLGTLAAVTFVVALLVNWLGTKIVIQELALFPRNSGLFVLAYLLLGAYIIVRIIDGKFGSPY